MSTPINPPENREIFTWLKITSITASALNPSMSGVYFKLINNYNLNRKNAFYALWLDLLNASGFAGVLPNGEIVDRRYYPDAISVQKNSAFGVVEPKKTVNEIELLKLGFKRIDQQNKNMSFEDYPHYYRMNENSQKEIVIENLNEGGCFVFCYGRYSNVRLDTIQEVNNLIDALIK